jgi:predicted Zn-dependent peptidase
VTAYEITRLANGLTVATAEMPHMASVSLGLWVGVGGRYEPKGLNGVCHFIEHLLFKGTARRSAREISQAVEGIGGYLNAFTGEESTCFYSRARHDRLEELLDVLSDMFLNSKFAPADVDKERNVIKEELAMYLDQPQHQVQEVLNAALWPGQPLGRPLTGTPESLDRITRKSLLEFRRAHYLASSTLIVAAGRVSHARLLEAVSRGARRFPAGRCPRFGPASTQQNRIVTRLVTREIEQTQIALGIRTCSRHDPRRFALRLLNTILGENMSSRLFQVVREDRGLAYSVYSSLSYFDDAGALVISAGLDTDNLRQTLRLVRNELRRLATTLPGAAEFRRARDYAIGQIDLGLEGTDPQMLWVGDQLIGYDRVLTPAAVKRSLARVRPADVRRVARAFFRPERLCLALVSPLKTDAGLARLLQL